MSNSTPFSTTTLPVKYNYLAPDGSEIRLLLNVDGGGLCHCTLPVGKTSIAVKHKTVEELWHFVSGEGEVWRKNHLQEEVTAVSAGSCISIPVDTTFQFRNTGSTPLCMIICTMPPWPTDREEAIPDSGYWNR